MCSRSSTTTPASSPQAAMPMSAWCRPRQRFRDPWLSRTCARLGIRLMHSAPYRAQGRGKIERSFNTADSQSFTEITNVHRATGVVDARVDSIAQPSTS